MVEVTELGDGGGSHVAQSDEGKTSVFTSRAAASMRNMPSSFEVIDRFSRLAKPPPRQGTGSRLNQAALRDKRFLIAFRSAARQFIRFLLSEAGIVANQHQSRPCGVLSPSPAGSRQPDSAPKSIVLLRLEILIDPISRTGHCMCKHFMRSPHVPRESTTCPKLLPHGPIRQLQARKPSNQPPNQNAMST